LVTEIQVSEDPTFGDAEWQPFFGSVYWTPTGEDGLRNVYAKVRDASLNESSVVTGTYRLDSTPPVGGIAVSPYVVGPDTESVNIYLAAEDNLSGVRNMRISTDPLLLLGEVWRPYTTSLSIPAYMPLAGELNLYVQFRDEAGNISETAEDGYRVDLQPPVVDIDASTTVTDTDASTVAGIITIGGYDGLSQMQTLRLSNEPSMLDAQEIPFTDVVDWSFDKRRVVWVQAVDSLGNATEAMPIYAELDEEEVSDSDPGPDPDPNPDLDPNPDPGEDLYLPLVVQ